jgi:Amt family ammonium transporter
MISRSIVLSILAFLALPEPAIGQPDPIVLRRTIDEHSGRLRSIEQEKLPGLQSKIAETGERMNSLDNKVTKGLEKAGNDGKALEERMQGMVQGVTFNVDRFWVMLAAVLVFFMQAGFKCLEVGVVQARFDALQAAQKLFSWITTYVGYSSLGFGLMFGATTGGWFGVPNWPEQVIAFANHDRGIEFFLFQAAFAATAVTIPAGATAERLGLIGYILAGVFIAAVIYPGFGHWAWGGSIYMDAAVTKNPHLQGWLQELEFHDFAGSTVVHSVGGWFALVGTLFLGPRIGRFRADGTVNTSSFPSRSLGYAILGVFMLWFGWWGFNGGSLLAYNSKIAKIIFNTNLAGAAAGMSAYLFAYREERLRSRWFQKGFIPEKTIGGVLGGLVAITASCDVASPFLSVLIGLSAGVVHNLVFNLLLDYGIDDPVGAFPVHTGCGIWGTLCVAFATGNFAKQFAVQLTGVLVAFVWTITLAAGFFFALKQFGLLNLGPAEEAVWIRQES